MAGARAVVVRIVIVVSEIITGHLQQVGMGRIHARIQDGDHHAGTAVTLAGAPSGLGLGVETGRAHRRAGVFPRASPVEIGQLCGVVVAPVVGVQWVIGRGGGKGHQIGQGGFQIGIRGQTRDSRFDIRADGHVDPIPAIGAQAFSRRLVFQGAMHLRHTRNIETAEDRVERDQSGPRSVTAGALVHSFPDGCLVHALGREFHQHPVRCVGGNGFTLCDETLLDRSEGPGIAISGEGEGGKEQKQANQCTGRGEAFHVLSNGHVQIQEMSAKPYYYTIIGI